MTHHVEEIMPVFSHALILKAGKTLAALQPLKHGKPGPAGKHGPKHDPKRGPKHGPKHKPPHKPKHDRADDAHA